MGGINSQMKAFLTKLFYSNPKVLEHRVISTVVSSRRCGSLQALSEFNAPFLMHSCILVGSTYWNEVHGDNSAEVQHDYEGIQTLKNLISNMSTISNSLRSVEYPKYDKLRHLNFISREYLSLLEKKKI